MKFTKTNKRWKKTFLYRNQPLALRSRSS